MASRKRVVGLSAYRTKNNPDERAFADAWAKQQENYRTLAYSLDPNHGANGKPPDPSERDAVVAATVIQWLGSPVGQCFLRDVGWEKR